MCKKSLPHATRLLALVSCLIAMAIGALAQSQATAGDIEGRVLNPQEAAVANASVTATNQQTGLEKSAQTDSEGNYRLILLPPGSYTVRASGQGFAQIELRDVTVSVGGKTPLDIRLTVSGTNESVTVTGEAPIVETTRTSVSTTVNERAIQNLPVNGRNYLDFATLTPGVVRDPTRTGDLSVGGQKGTLNNLQVDGVDNNNTFFGQAFGRTGVRPPYQFSEESVQEFQVNQNGFSAEFGRSGGAVINVVTKSGTNEFHGGAFEYFRDEALNANTPNNKATQATRGQPNKRTPQRINQFGARLGGPIVKNRAFFFFTYDGQRQNLTNPIETTSLFSLSSALQARVSPLLLPKLETYPINRDQDVYMAKGDIRINRANQLSLRFNRQNFTGVNNETTGQLNAQEHSGNSLARTTTFSGTLASTLSSKLVNEFRFQVARDAEPGQANSDTPEALIGIVEAPRTSTTTLAIGRNNFSPRETTIRRAQIVNNVLYVTGRHNFKTGLDFNFDRVLNFFPGLFGGQYTFPNYNSFVDKTPSEFRQNFAGPNTSGPTTHPDLNDYAAFVQDDWRVTPKLTLNVGLRYDLQTLAKPPVQNPDPQLLAAGLDTSFLKNDYNNFAPRFGFSYAFDDKSVLRGGYGIFYGRTTGIMLGTAHSQNGINVTSVILRNNATVGNQIAAAGLTYPNVLSAAPRTGVQLASLYLFARDYAQPYVQQGRLGIEREILPNLSFSATYLFFRGVHLSRTRDINLPAPVLVAANESAAAGGRQFQVQRFVAPRPFPRYDRINLFESTGDSLYNALALQAVRRFSRNFQFIAAYTFSKAKDNKPDQTSVVPGNAGDDSKIAQNQLDLRSEWANADTDIPHRFVFSPVYEVGHFTGSENPMVRALLSDYTFSGIVQLQSGVAYSATPGGDLNNDGNRFNDRAPLTSRNGFRTRSFYQLDARITRSIRLSEAMRLRFIVEGFNLLNRTNITGVNAGFYGSITGSGSGPFTFNSPSASSAFGLPRFFAPSRELQLALKFDF